LRPSEFFCECGDFAEKPVAALLLLADVNQLISVKQSFGLNLV